MSEELEYNQDLINRCLLFSDGGNALPSEEFYVIATELLTEAGIINDASEMDGFYHRDKNRGTQIDGWAWNGLEKGLYGIVIQFDDNKEEISPISRNETEKLGKKVAKVFSSLNNEKFMNSLGYETAARMSDIHSRLKDTEKFKIIVITNSKLTTRAKNTGIKLDNILEKDTSIEICDLGVLKGLEENDAAPTFIDFEELFNEGLAALSSDSAKDGQTSYLCVMPAHYLSKIYHQFGQRLLQSNVRSFLEFRGLANKGMRECLIKEPENFFVYNNGITVTATNLETKIIDGQLKITQLENMQIVNGGQTTCCIYFAPKDKGVLYGTDLQWSDIDLTKASVQMKLTILNGEDTNYASDMTSNISRYSNTQAAVNKADFMTHHPLHKQLEKLSRKQIVSGEDGIPSKWFYERSRGQYTVLLRGKGTTAQKNAFQKEYPKKQKFVKTDMAKYENTWRMHPDIVSKGAQNNLKALDDVLIGEWEKNENNFREPFFKDLIAKAIMFKTLDSEINRSDWYKKARGYKALTVTYTIAWLRNSLRKQDKDLNLKRIFDNGKLSESLLRELLKIARIIRDEFMDQVMNEDFRDGVQNISEFAKRDIAWTKVQKLQIEYDIPDDDFINQYQMQEQEEQDRQTAEAGEEIDNVEAILNISKNEWESLKEYLQETDRLPYTHENIKAVNKCVGLHDGGVKYPTEKQQVLALKIREKAKRENFSYISQD